MGRICSVVLFLVPRAYIRGGMEAALHCAQTCLGLRWKRFQHRGHREHRDRKRNTPQDCGCSFSFSVRSVFSVLNSLHLVIWQRDDMTLRQDYSWQSRTIFPLNLACSINSFACAASRSGSRDAISRLNFSLQEQIEKSFQIRAKPVRVLVSQIRDVIPDASASIRNQFQNSQEKKTAGARDFTVRSHDGRHAVADKSAAAPNQAVGAPPVRSAHGVKHGIHAARRKLAHAL